MGMLPVQSSHLCFLSLPSLSLEPYLHSFPTGFSLTGLLVFPEQDQHPAASVLWLPPVMSDLTVEYFLEAKSMCLSNLGSPHLSTSDILGQSILS